MKSYSIMFDNGKIRTLTVFSPETDPAIEIKKSMPLDSEIKDASIISIEEVQEV